MFDLQHSLVA